MWGQCGRPISCILSQFGLEIVRMVVWSHWLPGIYVHSDILYAYVGITRYSSGGGGQEGGGVFLNSYFIIKNMENIYCTCTYTVVVCMKTSV